MIDFPANPVVNQTFLAPNGVTYKWDGTKWTSIATGTVVPEAPIDTKLYGRKDAAWSEITKAALGLSNVDNTTDLAKPVSTAQAAAIALRVLKTGDTMTGRLTLTDAVSGAADLFLQRNGSGGSKTANLWSTVGSAPRWVMVLGDGTAESGSDAGSDFYLQGYTDAGVAKGPSLAISRSTGLVNFPKGTAGFNVSGGIGLSGSITAAGGLNTSGSGALDIAGNTALRGNVTVNPGTFRVENNGVFAASGFTWMPAFSGGRNGVVSSGYIDGSPRWVPLCDLASIGDAANCTVYHTPAVNTYWQFGVGGTGSVFQMWNDGHGWSPGGWNATSDGRVKTNRTVIENASAILREWRGYTFDRADMKAMDGTIPRKAGVIAQDIQKSLPEAVREESNGFLSLDLAGPIAVLVNAWNEMDQRLTQLENA